VPSVTASRRAATAVKKSIDEIQTAIMVAVIAGSTAGATGGS
jgi:hypothetical protein